MYHEKERAESALSDFFLAMKKGHHAPSSILWECTQMQIIKVHHHHHLVVSLSIVVLYSS